MSLRSVIPSVSSRSTVVTGLVTISHSVAWCLRFATSSRRPNVPTVPTRCPLHIILFAVDLELFYLDATEPPWVATSRPHQVLYTWFMGSGIFMLLLNRCLFYLDAYILCWLLSFYCIKWSYNGVLFYKVVIICLESKFRFRPLDIIYTFILNS